jgi:bifunctional non-homologous end joining protein LigD
LRPQAAERGDFVPKPKHQKSSSGGDSLAEYRRKRDFEKTPEPSGDSGPLREAVLRFVIQKHQASTLHYDLRLECGGVMKSWAVPKGLSVDPADKRLAMEVEDHPIEYNTFEGRIPKAEYGGGTVLLWDRGGYAPDEAEQDEDDETAVRDGLASGKLSFTLHGERLKGSYALVRTDGGAKPKWLVIKHRDRFAKPGFDIPAAWDTSVARGRPLDETASDRDSETWSSDAIAAMEALPVESLPKGSGWVFERRYEGTRLHAYATEDAVRLVGRGRNVTRRFHDLVERLSEVAEHAGRGFVLDGILDEDGSTFHVIDILFDGGDVMLGEPWKTRRQHIEALIEEFGVDGVEAAEVRWKRGRSLETDARSAGWTGIVAKQSDSVYQPGEENEDWQELVFDDAP